MFRIFDIKQRWVEPNSIILNGLMTKAQHNSKFHLTNTKNLVQISHAYIAINIFGRIKV